MTRFRFGLAMGGMDFHTPPQFNERVKRGGAGTAALTNTLEPSLYPTSPPQSSYKGGVPKLGGSEGGFIGLLVGLIVLILICCGVVYYLLRTRQHGGRAGNKNHPTSAAAPKDSKGFFSSLPFRDTRRQKAGWMQQGDEFDYDSDEDLMSRNGPAASMPKLGYQSRYGEGGSGYTGDRSKDIKPSGSDLYTDPFDPDHLPESVRRQQAPLPASTSSAPSNPPQYKSFESDSALKESPTSPTFEGGTKFREQF